MSNSNELGWTCSCPDHIYRRCKNASIYDNALLSQRIKFLTMSFGVDVLGTLAEKLKLIINEGQNHYESFIKVTELYKKEEMSEKEYFAKIVNYVITISAANFLAIRVILELKSAMDKGTSMKDSTGGMVSTPPQAGFGIGGFVGTGGTVGVGPRYTTPVPQAARTYIQASRHSGGTTFKTNCKNNNNNNQKLHYLWK